MSNQSDPIRGVRKNILIGIKCIIGKTFRSQNTGRILRILNGVQALGRQAYILRSVRINRV